MQTTRRRGFTVIELLVVIGVIGALTALLLPAVQAAREAARRAACRNNLKQIGLALHNYHSARRSFPPGNIQRTAGFCPGMAEPTVSYSTRFGNWMIAILPYLEQSALYDSYDPKSNNESPANRVVRETRVPTYVCPSDYKAEQSAVPASGPAAKQNARYAPGSYRAVTGRSEDGLNYLDSEMMFDYKPQWRGPIHIAGVWGLTSETIPNILDGLSNTLMVGEACFSGESNYRTFWAYSFAYYSQSGATAQERTLWGNYERCVEADGDGGPNPCKRGWGSFHSGGLNFLTCDGAVHFISSNIDLNLFGSLATIAGGEGASLPD